MNNISVPTDMIGLLWAVVIVLCTVVTVLGRVFWKRMEADRLECAERGKLYDEDRKKSNAQTMAFAKVMHVVVSKMSVPPGAHDPILGEHMPHDSHTRKADNDSSTDVFFKHG